MAQDNDEDKDLDDLLDDSENADDQKDLLEDDDGMDWKKCWRDRQILWIIQLEIYWP